MLMSCRHYVSLATDAREGALAPWAKARFAVHATICPHCRKYEKTMDATLALLRDQPAEPVGEEREATLLAALRAAPKR